MYKDDSLNHIYKDDGANFQRNDNNRRPRDQGQTPLPDAPPFTAFIGNLSFEVTEENIHEYFGEFGVVSVRIMKADNKSKGFGYIEFGDQQGLQNALLENGQMFFGRMLKMDVAKQPKERSERPERSDRYDNNWSRGGRSYQSNRNSYTAPSNVSNQNYENYNSPTEQGQTPLPDAPPFTAFIGNLSFEVSEDNLLEYFGELGVVSVRILKGDNNRSKGYGYIEFETGQGLQNALLSNGQEFYGRMLKMDVAKQPKERSERYDNNWSRGGRSYQTNRNSYTAPGSSKPPYRSNNPQQERNRRPPTSPRGENTYNDRTATSWRKNKPDGPPSTDTKKV
jgi:RNA recognition motif-containing protein